MCAHILRVRYEEPAEWEGLIKAQGDTLTQKKKNRGAKEEMFGKGEAEEGEEDAREWRVVQLAEPFDGTHKVRAA